VRLLSKKENSNNNSKTNLIMKPIHVILAVLCGAIAGAAVGVLLAPEKGVDTRTKVLAYLKEKGLKLKKNQVDELVEEIEDQVESVL